MSMQLIQKRSDFVSIGTIILLAVGLLVLFGFGQRVLDKMHLNDTQAIVLIAAMILGGFIPNIAVTPNVSINLGGFVIPVGVCLYLWFTAGTGKERLRSLIATALTGAGIFLLMRLLPDEPDSMWIDPTYTYGLAAGIIAYIFGRSRRGAFIAGTLGMVSANIATDVLNRINGVNQRLVLGGAGAMDAIVFSGIIAVLLAELMGEVLERITRRGQEPQMAFNHGQFVRKEPEQHDQ